VARLRGYARREMVIRAPRGTVAKGTLFDKEGEYHGFERVIE